MPTYSSKRDEYITHSRTTLEEDKYEKCRNVKKEQVQFEGDK